MMTTQASLTLTISVEYQKNLERLWTCRSFKKCCSVQLRMVVKFQGKISITSWPRSHSDEHKHFINHVFNARLLGW